MLLLNLLWLPLLQPVVGFAEIPQPAPYHHPLTSDTATLDFPPPVAHSRGYDVLTYDLDITLQPQPSFLSGSVDVEFQSLEDGLQLIHLDLVSTLDCLDVQSGGTSLFFEHLGDSLLVHLESALDELETRTIKIFYEGRPRPHGSFHAGLMFRKHNSGTNNDPSDDYHVIANVSETWSAHSWWPCKDHPADKALVSLTASVPDSLWLVSNGTLLGMESHEPGWSTFRWSEEYPLPTYLVSLAASNYVSWTEDCLTSSPRDADQIITLGFHVFPHDYADAQIDLARTCQAMNFMTDLAGPYPFDGEKYDQVEIKWGGAMEHSTATSLPTYLFQGTAHYENLVVHELAHQWFGDSLTPATWADIWLNEGFARYCEALWLEHTLGRPAYAEFMQQIGPIIHDDMFVGDGLLADPDPILPNFLVYDKGAWLLHSLRLLLGDDSFFDLLYSYATAAELTHGLTTTEDFIRLAEQQAGRNLDNFFDPWLNTDTVARLHSDVQVHPGGSTGTVHFKFQQLQETWLEMAIPVAFHCGGSQTTLNLVLDQREKEFHFDLDCPVDSVSVDPESIVFMQKANAPARFLRVDGPWPNPSSISGASFRFHVLENTELSVNMYDVRGRLVYQNSLGDIDATGPIEELDSTPFVWHFQSTDVTGLVSGVYWLEFRASGHRVVKKITHLH